MYLLVTLVLDILHYTVYYLLSAVQAVLWRLEGIHNKLQQHYLGEDYESSAQVLNIIWRRPSPITFRQNFIATHECFVHPEYCLRSNISLLTVTDKNAIFVEVPPDINVYDVRKFTFLYDALPSQATKLIIMPISSILKLSEKVGSPKCKVIWMYSTGRCGSTAFAQMFNSMDDTLVLSSPPLFSTHLLHMKMNCKTDVMKYVQGPKFDRLLEALVNLQLRTDKSTVFVKMLNVMTLNYADVLMRKYPHHKTYFVYRDIINHGQSFYKVSQNDSKFQLHVLMINIKLSLFRSRTDHMLLAHSSFLQDEMDWSEVPRVSFIGFWLLIWVGCCKHYLRVREKGFNIPAIKYEKFVENTRETIVQIFRHCEVSESNLTLALESLKEDSQKASTWAKHKTGHMPLCKLTPDIIKECDVYLNSPGVSSFAKLKWP